MRFTSGTGGEASLSDAVQGHTAILSMASLAYEIEAALTSVKSWLEQENR